MAPQLGIFRRRWRIALINEGRELREVRSGRQQEDTAKKSNIE